MSEYLNIATIAAKKAGEILKNNFHGRLQIEKKGAVDLVTDIDRKSEELIKNIILSKYPDHDFIAEEGTKSVNSSRYCWFVDPLDGTTNYAHGFPVYSVSIALVDGDEIIAGCVYNPNLDECFTAEKDMGAYLNGKPIRVSATALLDDSLLATGFPYDIRESDGNNLKEFSIFARKSQAIRRAGSAALDLAYLACGRFDGYWEFKLKPWDIAAGILLVNEAGGKVTSWAGDKCQIKLGEVLASNGLIHEQMLEVLGQTRKL